MPRPDWLEDIFEEESTGFVKLTFTDENGDLTTPVSAYFYLTAVGGDIIISKREITSLDSVVYVLLSGDDLRILDFEKDESFVDRKMIVIARYNSSRGNNLPLNKEVRFKVRNIRLIAQDVDVEAVEVVWMGDMVYSLVG